MDDYDAAHSPHRDLRYLKRCSGGKATADLRIGLLEVSLVLFLIAGTILLRAWLRRLFTETIVSNRRIILEMGLIGRNCVEMNLDRIENVMVNQGIVGGIQDYGTLVARSVGSGLKPIANVATPLEFHRQVAVGS